MVASYENSKNELKELFELYDIVYNWDNSNPTLSKIVDDNTWDIYDDIWNGMTFKECINKREKND